MDRINRMLLMLTVFALLAAACGADDAGARSTIVVTTSPLGDVVRNVVGDDAAVEVLIPIGADAHTYQPSSRQVAALQRADLVVANGLGLEEGLHHILESAADDGANVFEVAPLLDPLPFDASEGVCHPAAEDPDHSEGEEHDHGSCDPHVWLDPIRMGDAARLIAAELASVDSSVDWTERAEAYAEELAAADTEIMEMLGAVPTEDRKLVTNHEALGYFAARYGFDILGVVIPGGSTVADPSSAELAALVEVIETEDVPAIFAETSQPTGLADAVAGEVGRQVEVVVLYTESLGEPGSGAETLIGMLTTNAELIAGALL